VVPAELRERVRAEVDAMHRSMESEAPRER